jgi:hypothetical protein
MTRTINDLQWDIESPSFYKLANCDIRLVFDGARWWLYSRKRSGGSMHFESRAKAIEWLGQEIQTKASAALT